MSSDLVYEDTPETDTSIQWAKKPDTDRKWRSDHEYKDLQQQYRRECANHRQPNGDMGDPCIRCHERIDYCLSPDTLVLCTDLVWRPAGALMTGDDLIGFDEQPAAPGLCRKFRRSAIEKKSHLTTECVRITTDDGTSVVSSLEHRWFVLSGKTLRWKAASQLNIGDPLITVGEPWQPDITREGGYLAGIYDGEGYVGKSRQVGFAQLPGPVLDRAIEALKTLGISHGVYSRQKDLVATVMITGGIWNAVRALGSLRPVRLLPKAHLLWEGTSVFKGGTRKTRVVAVESISEHEVIGLRTSTGTLIANGLLTHNSLQYPHPLSWSLEHKIPASERPELRLDRNNFASAHFTCNSVNGNKGIESDIGTPSENW